MCKLDILLFTETWHEKKTNLSIEGYDCFSCPQPKSNSRAKRGSGGVVVYFRHRLKNYVHFVELNQNSAIWFKLSKELFNFDVDLYLCLCYIPPEDS